MLLALPSRFAAILRRAPKLAPPLAFAFSHACLALALLFYPAFLQLGAHNGSDDVSPGGRFDFCTLEEGESAQSCAISTRLFVRSIQSAAGDARACLQAPGFGKFVFHPGRSGNWDKTSLQLYASMFEDSEWESKWIKARLASLMLKQHRKIDRDCQLLNSPGEIDQAADLLGP